MMAGGTATTSTCCQGCRVVVQKLDWVADRGDMQSERESEGRRCGKRKSLATGRPPHM